MSRSENLRSFADARHAAAPGDVFLWHLRPDKLKFHVCLSFDHDFAFVNSPKDRRYEHDFHIAADDMRFIRPTPERLSFVSCSLIGMDAASFESRRARLVGNLTADVTRRLLSHFCHSPTIETEDAERLLEVAGVLSALLAQPADPASPRPGWPPEGVKPLRGGSSRHGAPPPLP